MHSSQFLHFQTSQLLQIPTSRDRTPEATLAVADRNVPGISEAIRAGSMTITKRAMLSRGVSVIRKKNIDH